MVQLICAGNSDKIMQDFEPFSFGTHIADTLELCIDKEMSKYVAPGGLEVADTDDEKVSCYIAHTRIVLEDHQPHERLCTESTIYRSQRRSRVM